MHYNETKLNLMPWIVGFSGGAPSKADGFWILGGIKMLQKKKSILISAAVLVCLAASILSGCSGKAAEPETVAPTEAATETAPIAATNPVGVLANVESKGALESWELTPAVWSSSNGATVTFTGHPRAYEEGQSGSFVVRLNGEMVENAMCTWDGSYYTASVDLEAADGYEYEFVLFSPQGSAENYTLSDAYDSLVYMKRSLDTYCNLFISDFKEENGQFVVTAGYASVQLPQLTTAGASVGFQKAQLVFMLNGEECETKDIDLPQGEGQGSYESSLSNISFKMPQMEDDYQLDLMLVVTLSDGTQLPASNGGSWFYNSNELKMAAG